MENGQENGQSSGALTADSQFVSDTGKDIKIPFNMNDVSKPYMYQCEALYCRRESRDISSDAVSPYFHPECPTDYDRLMEVT